MAQISPFNIDWCKDCHGRFSCPWSEVTYRKFKNKFPAGDLDDTTKYKTNFLKVMRKTRVEDKAWKILVKGDNLNCVRSWSGDEGVNFLIGDFVQFILDGKLWPG